MKFSSSVSSSRRKCRKAHFTADAHTRAKIMSARLSKDLRTEYDAKTMPIRKDDEVTIFAGGKKVGTSGKVLKVYRKTFRILVENVTHTSHSGRDAMKPKYIPIHPSNVMITKLHITESRKKILARKGVKKAEETME